MYNLITNNKYLLIFLIIWLAACSVVPTNDSKPITPTNVSLTIAESTEPATNPTTIPTKSGVTTPTIVGSVTPEYAPTASIILEPIPSITPMPYTPTPELVLRSGCPNIIDNNSPPWANGSILFGTGLLHSQFADPYQPEQPGIWGISSDNLSPKLAYTIPPSSSSWVLMSDDGNILLRHEYTNKERTEEEHIFFDLAYQKEIRIAEESKWALKTYWLPDGRVKILTKEEKIWEVGVRREYLLIDPVTQQSEIVIEELDLPGYQFADEMLPSGYAAVSPDGNLVLYTAFVFEGVDVLLFDLQTREIVWQQNSKYLLGYPEPIWADDGSHVLFMMHRAEYESVVSLTRDGQMEELPPQPFPALANEETRYLTRSPDGRYIVYGLWGSARQGPGFVVDTVTWEAGEICDSAATFIDGQWLPDGLFAYRVELEDGNHSLRVLDIPAWTTQVLFESSSGYGVNIFGWTSVEFP